MDNNTAGSTGSLPSAVIQQKRIIGRTKTGRRSQKHIIRATAKQWVQSNPALCQELNLPCTCSSISPGASRRAHLEQDLEHLLFQEQGLALNQHSRNRSRWRADENEGRDLALSGVPLPSDRSRLARTPSLERQEAFHDATTSKVASLSRRTTLSSEDAEVAELYRLGLLYDDEKDRGSGFDLNSIAHEQPLYPIRQSKRMRKTKRKNRALEQQLYLDLSFTDLGGDDAIAQYLSPPPSEPSDDGDSQNSTPGHQSDRFNAPLRVIYEVDGSNPSLDVDTSQPPDLVSDLLSDYDCFSDSEFDDDLPSQREVTDSAAAPASDAWVVLGDDS